LMHIFLTFFQICSGSSLLVPIFPVGFVMQSCPFSLYL
jgi:hypothetical protein